MGIVQFGQLLFPVRRIVRIAFLPLLVAALTGGLFVFEVLLLRSNPAQAA